MTEKFRTRRRPLTVLIGLFVVAVVLVGCGSLTTSALLASPARPTASCPQQNVPFDESQFVLHAGLGSGAFHHLIYKPFTSGEFAASSRDRMRRFADAGMAAVFAVHELQLAKQEAEANPALCRVVAAPLDDAATNLGRISGQIRSGNVSGRDLDQINNSIGRALQGSAQAGIPVTDKIPSPQQLDHPS
jgi:hypothetical protein